MFALVFVAFITMFVFYGAWQLLANLWWGYWVMLGVAFLIVLPFELFNTFLALIFCFYTLVGRVGTGISDDGRFKALLQECDLYDTDKRLAYAEFLEQVLPSAPAHGVKEEEFYTLYLFYYYCQHKFYRVEGFYNLS